MPVGGRPLNEPAKRLADGLFLRERRRQCGEGKEACDRDQADEPNHGKAGKFRELVAGVEGVHQARPFNKLDCLTDHIRRTEGIRAFPVLSNRRSGDPPPNEAAAPGDGPFGSGGISEGTNSGNQVQNSAAPATEQHHQGRRKRPSSYSIIEVYDGLKRLGVVERLRRGGFRPLTVDDRALGRFSRDREVARALLRLMAGGVA